SSSKHNDMANGIFFSSRRRHTRFSRDWSSDVCSSDLIWQNTAADLEEMAKFNANGHRFHPGTIKVVDQNGDYRISADDQVIRGSNRPDWTGGITNTFRYKNWTLSSFIYARVGRTYFGGYPNSYVGVWPKAWR